MNIRNALSFVLSASLLLLSACGGDDDPVAAKPENLTINVTQSADGSGKVDVVASATNAKYYVVDFGDGTNPVQTIDGTASHTYSIPETYTIKVNAHVSNANFITGEKEVIISVNFSDEGYKSPETRAGYSMAWQDEFSGNGLSSDWTPEIGGGGWGNNELQYYRAENATVAGGYLTITAKKESFGGRDYTSSRLITKGKREFTYGRIDVRAKLPKGQGIWPAIWMLGANISTVGWPKCGEIDIMEMIGGSGRENTVHGTVHYDDNGHKQYGGSKTLTSGTYSDKFHVYSIEWTSTSIKWFIDDVQFHVMSLEPSYLTEFKEPRFFILNVAVGGNWPQNPDGTTQFPQSMIVDYVRVFQ